MKHLFFLTIPGLRAEDIDRMPQLKSLFASGDSALLTHSFPAVTWPAQSTVLTGKRPAEHGVIANGFYWRDEHRVEMWTAGNEVIQAPQMWDVLQGSDYKTAAWFPMLSKRCNADYVCMPAPVHNPDGSESLWCYTQPSELYADLLDQLGHFPLQHFWGPMANIKSTQWILESAEIATEKFAPHLFYLYLPHLDYAAQRNGPDSEQAEAALRELDTAIGHFSENVRKFLPASPEWMVLSEYTIGEVDHVLYPNRLLREAGLLEVSATDEEELIDFENSAAWALVDHQFSHVFVQDNAQIGRVQQLFAQQSGVTTALAGEARSELQMDHERSGEVVVVSQPNSWQSYYWWLDDSRAPAFARTVDIHRKPGYDPVELFWDREANAVPLNADMVRGSHGAPHERNDAVLLSTLPIPSAIHDTDVASHVLKFFA